jgi:hypothetical protein
MKPMPSTCYIGKTSKPLEVCIKDKYNLTQCLLEKSKLAQHAHKEGHNICWNEAKVLQIQPNTTYRKYKKSAQVSLIDHPITQPSDISLIWTPLSQQKWKKYNSIQCRLCPEDRHRIQSPKHCVFKLKQNGILDKNRIMDIIVVNKQRMSCFFLIDMTAQD